MIEMSNPLLEPKKEPMDGAPAPVQTIAPVQTPAPIQTPALTTTSPEFTEVLPGKRSSKGKSKKFTYSPYIIPLPQRPQAFTNFHISVPTQNRYSKIAPSAMNCQKFTTLAINPTILAPALGISTTPITSMPPIFVYPMDCHNHRRYPLTLFA